MNAPVVLAQLQGTSLPTGAPPRHIKLEKPQSGATVTVYLNGPIQLDFADIASDKLTFVRVGDKLVVLFDNQSTVTLEPVFGPDGHPLNNIIFEMAPDHMLTGDQFASDFPITTDQSILPAAGSGPTSGAHFSDPTVDALSTGTALALLGAENNGRSVNGFSETPANAPPSSTPIALVVLNEDGLPGGNPGGPGDVGTLATTFTGSLNINFGTALVGRTASFAASQPGLNGLTSGGEAVHFVVTTAHGEPTLIGYVGTDPAIVANEVLTVTLDATATANGEFTVTLMRPLDDPIHGVEDNLILNIGVIATNGVGRSTTNTISVEVNDDSPIINVANETHSTIIDAVPGSVVTAAGSLGISFGADNFNTDPNGGDTGQNGDRAVFFTNSTVTTTGDNHGVVTSFTGLTSENQAVHYVLLDNGTTLVAYTGNTAPTAIPTDATSAASEHVVFTVALTDDSATGGYIVAQYEPLDHISGGTKFDSIDLTFNFTATDSDGDPVSGTLTLTVGDTVPTVTAVTAETVGEDGLPDGNHIKGDVQAVSVTSSLDVNWGSDNETVNPGGSFGRTLNFLAGDDSTVIAGGTKAVSSLAMTISGEQGTALSSEGVALVYVVTSNGNGGETLTAHQGSTTGAVIFTLSLDPTAANGAYTFTLNGPLDDAAGSNNIALNFTVQATDADGDAVNQSFTVNVQDDVPIAGTGMPETVKEANLFDGSSPDIHDLTVTGSLNVSWGADNNDSGNTNNRSVSFQHASASADVQVTDGNGNTITGLTSNGATVQYLIFNGELIAYTNNDPFHHQVFTVSLNDDGSGSYTFTLLNNLDHPAGNGNNTLNLTFDFTATDSDGDPSSNTFTVTVVDDVPTAGVGDVGFINEANLPNGNAPLFFGLPVFPQVSGDLHITWGADNNLNPFSGNSRSVSFTNSNAALDVTATSTDPTSHVTTTITGLTSDGHAINYAFLGGELVAYTGNNPHFNQVFTVTLSPLNDGSYTFTLLGTLDNPPGQGTNPINLTFSYTATDSDGDTSSNLFAVSVKDSVPLAFGADNGHVDEDDLPTGTSPHASALSDTESLHIGWGSDDSTRSLGDTFGRTLSFLAGDNSTVIPGSSSLVSSLAMSITGEQGNGFLSSGGVALVYTVTANVNGGETLTAFKGVGGPEIFTLTLDPTANNGAYTFTLMGPLDDAAKSNSIGLTFNVQAADADGDPVNTSFTVSIADDQPTDSQISTKTVGEEGLSFANHNVNGEAQNASVTTSLNINWGADNNNPTAGGGLDDRSVAFASNMVSTLNGLHLTSNGQSLSYAISTDPVTGGQLLTATAGSDHHTVFTVLLSDANNGSYTFTLSDNLDHASSNTAANNQALTFSVVATDSDGDSVNQSFTVNVQDDVPVLSGNVTNGTVSEDGLSSGNHINGVSQVVTLTNEALNISWGADSATHPGDANGRMLSFNVNNNHGTITPVDSSGHALNLTSDGTALQYVLTNLANGGQEIDAYRGSSHTSANLIFTVTLDPTATDGAYSFTLSGNLDDLTSNGQPTSDLKLNFGVTAADSDGDTVQTNFTVDVLDDTPIARVGASDTLNEANLPHGSSPNAAALAASGSLNIEWGADNGSARSVAFSNASVAITDSNGNAVTAGLTSDGLAVHFAVLTSGVNAGWLVAYTGNQPTSATAGNVVFNVALDNNNFGDYTLNLLQTLDDPSNSNSLKFTFNYTATDSDGDKSSSVFSVTVDDDTPIIGTSTVGDVSEDKPLTLTNAPLNVNLGADNGTFAGSHLALSFTGGLVAVTDAHGTTVALTSYGNAVHIGFIGTELIGYTGTTAPTLLTDSHIVFTASLSTNGTYDFALKQPLDNPAPVNGDPSINLTFDITATDADGSTATGHFTVNVDAAGSTSTPGVIDYSNETSGVFVNLTGSAVTFGGQTVAAHSATDLASGGAHVIGIDQLGTITGAIGGSGNDVFAITNAQFASAPHISGSGGTDTIDIVTTTGFNLVDADFANVSGIETLKVAPGAGDTATITLGADASAEVGTGTLTVDASGEDSSGFTVVDFTAMTAKFAFVGGDSIVDIVTVTNAQFESGLSLRNINTIASDTVIIADAADVTDAAFASVRQFEVLQLGDFTNSVTLGADAAADAVSAGNEFIVDGSAAKAGHDLTVDASAFGTASVLLLFGGAGDDLFKVTASQLNSALLPTINAGGGTDTIEIVTTSSFSLVDNDFIWVSGVETLEVAPGAGGVATITLGADASAEVGSGTFTVDASGESSTGSTVVDASAMTAKFAFDGGAGNDTVKITSTQFTAAPHIAGGGGSNTLVITDAGGAVVDADFANSSNIQTLKVQSATITLGADASAEIGTGILTVDASAEGAFDSTNVDFTAMTAKFAFVGGSENDDAVTVTNAQFESGLSLSATNSFGIADETIFITGAADITDAAFASVTQFATLELGDFTNSVTLGVNASADAASVDGGAGGMVVNGSAATAGHNLTVDASDFDDSLQLFLFGGAGDDLFKVTAAGLDSGNFSIDGEGGSNTIELVGTTNFSLDENAFSSVSHIGTLKVDGSSGANDKLTLGENADKSANGSTFTIDDTAGHENLTIDAAQMASDLVVSLGSGNDTVTGGLGTNTFIGGTGADDFIWYVGEAQLETVIGGAGPGIQTQTVDNPVATPLTFVVGAIDATHLGVSMGVDASTAALNISDTNVQELVFNLGSQGDTVVIDGSLDGTGIATNTITINGGAGNDTVDLSKFTSGQDVVYNGAGNGVAGDTVIYGFAFSAATYAPILDSNGHLIGASITYQSADGAVTDTITNVENFKFADQTVSLAQLFAPTITSGNSGTEAEGTPVNNIVYHIAATDQNPNAVLTYSLSGADAADFNVSSTGDVTFKSVPNFETQSAYNIIVHVNDGTTDATEAVTIHVTDVAPVAVADSYIEVKNTTATVNAASGVLANDSDVAGGALTAVLVSGPSHDSSFTLNADGSFTYKAANNFTGTDTFTYEASDGTDLSNPVTVTLTVHNANDAPVLTAIMPHLTSVHGINGGQTVASFIGSSITDVDAGAVHGIAITADTSANGTWQFSTNGGVSWTNFGTVSGNSSLLLKDTDLVRYTPSNNNGASDTFTYRAWDETSGTDGNKSSTSNNGGSSAFSTATDTAHITEITGANHAPVLTPSSPTLATITEDQTNPAGTTIATLLGSHVSDADPQALQGIAISGATSTHGTWEFSTNGGSSWQNFGTYSTSSALLLAATDEVRFVPDAIDGSTDTFSFVAWDQTTGTHGSTANITTTGGTTAFSAASDTASISVTAIDDAPVVHSPTGVATAPQGAPVTITGLSVSDVDAGNAPISVTLTVAHGAISLASTAGLTFTDSDGSNGTLAFTGSQTAIDTALASGVVYTSTGNYLGSDAISVNVNDLGNTGQGGPLSGTGSASISVVTPHHAPAGTDNTVTTNEDTHYAFTAANFGFSDPNDTPADTFTGVVITTLPTAGTLTDNGAVVTSGETIGIADINAGDLVFTPAANANGTDYASFTFQVQDNGIAYTPENTDQSPNTMTINVTAVNDAPTISYAGPQSSPTNIVVNGGFETGDLTGWSQSEISIMATNGGGLSHSGFHAAEAFFQFGGPAQDLTQTLATVVGQTYTIDFWVMHSTAVPSLSDSFTASFGSTQVVSLTGTAAENSFGYTEFTGTAVATSTSTVLDFNFFDTNNNGGGYIWYLDDVSVVAKPQNIASVNEGTNLVFSTANGNALQVADIDVNETPAPNNIMQVTLGVAHGDLTLSETAGISFISGGNGTGAMVIQGTLAALDSALNGLTYQADNFSGSDTLSINVNDLGHTGIGGPQSANSSVVITVVQNIPASFGGTDTGSVTEAGGVNNSIPGTPATGGALAVTDPDSSNAVVAENNIATLYGHFSINVAGVWSYVLDNTNPTVDALNTTSTPLQDVMTITTADGSQHQIDVTIHGANDAAIFSGADTGSVTEAGGVNNGTAGVPTTGGTLIVSDVDSPATIMAENNVATAYGHFSIDANGVWSYTLDDNNATVQALNTNSTPLQDVITVTSADGTTHQIDVTINGADDASVNTVPGAQAVSNAAQLTFSAANGDAISVADVDNTTLTETLTVSHGTLTLASEAGLSFSAGHDGTSTMTFTGTVAAIDSALDGLIYTPASGYSGADTLQIATNDGSLETDSSAAITVFVPDHPPVITSAAESGTVVANASFNVPLGQLVSDGGFENTSLSPPWTVVDQAGDTATTTGGGHSGDDAGFLTATTNTGDVIKLSQTLNTVAGVPYTISFWMQSINPLPSGSFSSLRVLWDGTSELFLQNMSTANNWVEYTLNVIGTGQDTIQFNMQDRVTFILLDDVSVQANFTPGTETSSGQITFTDADTTDTHTVTAVAGGSNYIGTFTPVLTHDTTGSGTGGTVNWTFSATDAQISALVGAQQSITETYTVTINDGHGGVASQIVTIDITNPDHAPQITSAPETGSVTEYLSNSINPAQLILNGGFESGGGLSNWTTTKNSGLGDVIEFQSFPAQAGKQSLNVWTGTDNPGDVVTLKQSVAGTVAGEAYTLTFFVSNQDDFDPANFIHVLWNNQTVLSLNAIPLSGFGDYTEYSATLAGTGTTSTLEFDFQNAGGNYTFDSVSLVAATTPGTEKTAGIITFTDADAGDTHTVSVAPIAGATGYIGTLTATISGESTSSNPGTVNWTYSVSDAAAASIGAGNSVTQTYVVTINDGHGGVVSQNVTVTINGAAPDLTPPTVTFTGDTLHSGSTNDSFTGKISDNATGLVTIQLFSGNSPGTIVSGASTSVFVTGGAAAATWTISANTSLTSGSGHTAYVQATDASGNVAISANKNLPAGVSGEAVNLALTDYSDHSGLIAATITGLAAGWVLSEGIHNADGSWSVLTSDIGSLTVTSPDGYVGALVANVTESWTNANGTHGTAVVADNIEAYAQGSPIFAWSGDDTLTASAGNDTLVFANQIGNDVVHNFDTMHDKIDLVGFNGFASFADVQAHLSHDASGNAVITLADGETVTLTGVAAASLNAGDFEFNQTPVTTNTGDMVISDGAMMPLSGIVDNTGSIHLGSAGNETDLEIVQHGVTLEGGGTLVLSDNAENVIFGSDASVTFTNVDNTISGAGQLGDGQMALVNEGTIVADSSNALVIDTGSNAVVNTGTLEALGLGGLIVHSDLVNEGVLWANGGNLTLDGDVSGSGSARISGSASLEIGGAFAEQVQFDDNASGTLKIDHSADFKGLLSGLGGHDAIDLGDILAANASISYTANAGDSGGILTVTDGSNTANIALSGEYASADFHLAADQSNHALVQIEQHAQHMAAAA